MRIRQAVGTSQELSDGEIRTGDWSEEITVRMFKFRHSSRVCRRTFGSRNGLHTIPENEAIEFKNLVRSPVLNMRSTKLTPATKATTSAARRGVDAKSVQVETSKKPGFWKAFKLKPSSSRKTKHHQADAASLLSFV
uniref:Uncharacterized protein n=1 Tax=Lygus hesperus TaxID=30085 RepID=A0A146MFQ7_LYGHE